MEFLLDHWLPILLSAVFVFMTSSVLHMVVQHHNKDYKGLDQEAAVMEAMRASGVTPGHYALPFAPSMKEAGSPEMLERYGQGPVGILTVLENGPPNMGRHLRNWFLYTAVISALVAYVASFTLEPGAAFMEVLRLAGTVGFLCYGGAEATQSIWKGQSWCTTLRFLADSLAYGLVTGATFAWLWPA